jgi:uncharacterized membrane protein YczE
MKYVLTTFTALSLGSLSFRVSQMFNWNLWVERAFVLIAALIVAALVCAPLWG